MSENSHGLEQYNAEAAAKIYSALAGEEVKLEGERLGYFPSRGEGVLRAQLQQGLAILGRLILALADGGDSNDEEGVLVAGIQATGLLRYTEEYLPTFGRYPRTEKTHTND